MGDVVETGAINRDELVEVFGREFFDRSLGDVDPGGIDDDVGDAEFPEGRDDLLPVGDVAGFDLEVFSGDGPEFVFVASADGDGASGFGEGFRGAEPDAASTAGDDGCFS